MILLNRPRAVPNRSCGEIGLIELAKRTKGVEGLFLVSRRLATRAFVCEPFRYSSRLGRRRTGPGANKGVGCLFLRVLPLEHDKLS
jgi:hypothetical protein